MGGNNVKKGIIQSTERGLWLIWYAEGRNLVCRRGRNNSVYRSR